MGVLAALADPLDSFSRWMLKLTWGQFAWFTLAYYAVLGHVLLSLWQLGML